jgi:hypothetical protein
VGCISLEWAKDKLVGMLSAIIIIIITTTTIIIVIVAVSNMCNTRD